MDTSGDTLDAVLRASEDDRARVDALMAATNPSAEGAAATPETISVPVDGAEIRVLHFTADTGVSPVPLRPVLMVPGFGATIEGFEDFVAVLNGKTELFYLETREKASSKVRHRGADMSVRRSARDIQQAIDHLGLAGRDIILMAPCWGATIVLQGLIEGVLDAPTIVLADPMHALWFPRWVLRYVSPVLPAASLLLLRPIVARSMLGDMEEPAQKKRAMAFVRDADVWKWKKSAEAARNEELFGRLSAIRREVLVVNGTRDRIHDPRFYPRVARELPRGRFFYLPTDERFRERLFGTIALALARVSSEEPLPESIARFERQVR